MNDWRWVWAAAFWPYYLAASAVAGLMEAAVDFVDPTGEAREP